jgi:type IV pilus assembly protein PilC
MSIFEPQLSNNALAELCHRLAVETDSGIDIRRTCSREAESAHGRVKPHFESIRDAVGRGDSLAAAFARTGSLFPPLFLEMSQVGEQTGTLGRVLRRLETHYRRQVQAKRLFLGAIMWPLLELAFAIIVIGLLIWILGIIAQRNNGQPIDILGFGLVGTRGLIIYSLIVATIAACIAGVIFAIRRGALWTRPLQRAFMRIPVIGRALEQMALARLAWALHLTLNVEMDLRRIVPLSLRTTGNDYYVQHSDRIVADINRGDPMHVAFSRSGAFPGDFIDALTVAEESGRIVESMERLSNRYEEEAELALRTLSVAFGWLVGACVMGIIVFLIFRLAGFYLGTINEALEMANHPNGR